MAHALASSDAEISRTNALIGSQDVENSDAEFEPFVAVPPEPLLPVRRRTSGPAEMPISPDAPARSPERARPLRVQSSAQYGHEWPPPGHARDEHQGESPAQPGAPASARLETDLGPFASLLADPSVTDIVANGAGTVLVDRGHGFESTDVHLDEPSLRALAVRLIAAGGRHLDEASPCVDVRLGSGMRVHAVLPAISPTGTLLSIRVPRGETLDLAALEAGGCFELVTRAKVQDLVEQRANVLITGAGGAGKTTLLAAMLSAAPASERIVAVEDVAELRVEHPHFVSLEARQANLEGAGEIDLPRLVREALRMRPDRLVLGECRGVEVRELLSALNTGHDGGAGTLHANSLDDVPARLEALGALAGMSDQAVARQSVSAIDAVLHVERREGRRRIAQLGRFTLDPSGRLAIGAL